MGCTLDQLVIHVQELVFLPFQICTGMRALVEVGEKFTVLMNHKNRLGFAFDFDLETFAAGVIDISSFAENVCHDVW